MNLPEPVKADLIEAEIDRVLTQYRESPNLLFLIRNYLGQVADVIESTYRIPSFFDLDTAVGEQLTFLGKRLGWPRCHCVCATQPVLGFECEGVVSLQQLGGLCDDTVTWDDCGPFGIANVCLNDDELYRSFLKVRRYQMLALFDLESLTDAIRIFWGPTALVLDSGEGRVVIAPGRDLTAAEAMVLALYPRVLPVAPGIRAVFHFGDPNVLGMGEGWAGLCLPVDMGELEFLTESGDTLLTENGDVLVSDFMTVAPPLMCEIDVNPYNCNLPMIGA